MLRQAGGRAVASYFAKLATSTIHPKVPTAWRDNFIPVARDVVEVPRLPALTREHDGVRQMESEGEGTCLTGDRRQVVFDDKGEELLAAGIDRRRVARAARLYERGLQEEVDDDFGDDFDLEEDARPAAPDPMGHALAAAERGADPNMIVDPLARERCAGNPRRLEVIADSLRNRLSWICSHSTSRGIATLKM